MEEKAKE